MLAEGLTSLQSLILRSVANIDVAAGSAAAAGAMSPSAQPGLQLSFTDSRKLCRLSWPALSLPGARAARECWVPNLAVDQAVPVFAAAGKGVGDFLSLPDRSRPWVVTLNRGSPSRGSDGADVKGVPVGLPPDVSNRLPGDALHSNGSPAASPNQQHLARIAVAKDAFRVERRDADKWVEVTTGSKWPIAVTLNDRGMMVVLEEGRGASEGPSVTLVQPGGGQAVLTPLVFDGACLKLTPDGHRALVAGRGRTRIIELDAREGSTALSDPQKEQTLGKGAGLTACAVGNDGAIMSGFSDGTVSYAPPTGKPVPLSAMVQFRLPREALDVSIDATGRFVAVVGRRADGICLGVAPGYPVRIWDLNQPHRSFPVASGCLPYDKVVAIGPLQTHAGHWVLPVFEESGGSARRFEYDCLACGGAGSNASATNARIVERAEKNFRPKPLSAKEISDSYGIEP